MSSRRDFLKQGTAAAGAVALSGALHKANAAIPAGATVSDAMDAPTRDLLLEAIGAEWKAGDAKAEPGKAAEAKAEPAKVGDAKVGDAKETLPVQ